MKKATANKKIATNTRKTKRVSPLLLLGVIATVMATVLSLVVLRNSTEVRSDASGNQDLFGCENLKTAVDCNVQFFVCKWKYNDNVACGGSIVDKTPDMEWYCNNKNNGECVVQKEKRPWGSEDWFCIPRNPQGKCVSRAAETPKSDVKSSKNKKKALEEKEESRKADKKERK